MNMASETTSDERPIRGVKSSPLNEAFRTFAQETMEKWHIQGLSIAVIDGDETWSQGYGIAALPDIPTKPSTLFYTGSTTKSFTAAAASLLVDDEKYSPCIKWTTPLANLIPGDFAVQDEYASAHITLEDALSHRSGLPGHMLTLGREGCVRDTVRCLRHLPMDKEIRSSWQYSNAMFIAVSHAIENVTGVSLGEFLCERVWLPLDMRSTFLSLPDALDHVSSNPEATFAKPYAWDKSAGQPVELPHCKANLSGAGGIISNVLDYAKYVRSMIRKSGPLSEAGYTEVLRPRSVMPNVVPQFMPGSQMYSLGWMSGVYRGEPVFLHPGGVDGMTSAMIFLPERDWGVVAFCNALSWGQEVLAWRLIDDLLEVPQEDRVDLYEIRQQSLAEQREKRSKVREELYPTATSPGRPSSLLLTEYVGTYKHPTYPDLVIRIPPSSEENTKLCIDMSGGLDINMDLVHISGEFFLAEVYQFAYEEPTAVIRAEFYIDVTGRATRFGITIDYKDMPDTLIWFERSE